jgi:acyl-CoA reductase-like NAD-dependent aldehyde dehydrogenase
MESASATLKHVSLELGGNDPGIVLADADPNAIAQDLFNSMFLLSGQGCICLKAALHPRKYLLRVNGSFGRRRSVCESW